MKNEVEIVRLEGGMETLRIELRANGLLLDSDNIAEKLEQSLGALRENDELSGAIIDIRSPIDSDLLLCNELLGQLTLDDEDVAATCRRYGRLSTVLRSLECCGKPVVALLAEGATGLGLEIALACHYRIAVSQTESVFSMEYLSAGLITSAGGSQRLLRLLGIESAIGFLIKGDVVHADSAKAMGLVDQLVERKALHDAGRHWLEQSEHSAQQKWDVAGFRVPGGAGQQTDKTTRLFMSLHGSTMAQTQGNYPAIRALIATVYEGSLLPMEAALRVENRNLVELLRSPVAKNLVRTLKVGKTAADDLVHRPAGFDRMYFDKVAVLGAGMMGAGIAYCAAAAGVEVVLLDRTIAQAEAGKDYSRGIVAKFVAAGTLAEESAQDLLHRIHPTVDYSELSECQLVIEAVFEDLKVKAEVTRLAEAAMPASAIFASNTSTIRIAKLAEASVRPEQFIGLHFSSPVDRMPILEIIVSESTSRETLARSMDFSAAISKTPIVVSDHWGFYLSRVFGCYIEQGGVLLAKGVAPALIENAGRQVGMPIGPLALSDEVSLELSKHIQDSLRALAGDEYKPSKALPIMELFVDDLGRLGRKSGGGFYEYPESGAKYLWPGLKDHFPLLEEQPSVEEVKKSLLYRQALEAVRTIEENVVANPCDADVCAVVGWNFPAYTGGPLAMIDTVGVQAFNAECRQLAGVYGEEFMPPQRLLDMERNGRKFYTT
jgi:3-hydroxyacyl-CoA dehydrogenase/enoyl-CoA hydratase/3-hydroxybutyryl-CoA epimerase